MRKSKDYALYRGDEFIDLGPIKEMAKRLHIAEKTLRFYSSPTHCERVGNNGYICFEIEED